MRIHGSMVESKRIGSELTNLAVYRMTLPTRLWRLTVYLPLAQYAQD